MIETENVLLVLLTVPNVVEPFFSTVTLNAFVLFTYTSAVPAQVKSNLTVGCVLNEKKSSLFIFVSCVIVEPFYTILSLFTRFKFFLLF